MSDKKPFWEGKTCNEMAGLHVKVTFKNGSILTGKTNPDANIVVNYLTVRLSYRAGDEPFLPIRGIDTIELLDNPNYERIEEADDLQEKDIAVTLDGNRYKVTDVEKGRNRFWGRVYGAVGQKCIALGFNAFTYGLRPKPRLPDHDGLWLDKGDGLWLVTGTTVIEIAPKDQPVASISYPASSIEASERLSLFAPFRPAKAVEA